VTGALLPKAARRRSQINAVIVRPSIAQRGIGSRVPNGGASAALKARLTIAMVATAGFLPEPSAWPDKIVPRLTAQLRRVCETRPRRL